MYNAVATLLLASALALAPAAGRAQQPDTAALLASEVEALRAFAMLDGVWRGYDPGKRSYTLHLHAQGLVGDFAFTPTSDGYTWEVPIGPATLRYTATVKDGKLHEVGDRIATAASSCASSTCALSGSATPTGPAPAPSARSSDGAGQRKGAPIPRRPLTISASARRPG